MKIFKYLIPAAIVIGIIFFISGEKEIASLDRPIPANLSENLREDTRNFLLQVLIILETLVVIKLLMEKLLNGEKFIDQITSIHLLMKMLNIWKD